MRIPQPLRSLPARATMTAIGLLASFFLGMYVQDRLHPPVTNYVYLPSDDDQAKAALIIFLDSLYKKDYAKAASVYGGDYATLKDWNPPVDPADVVTLWRNGCEMNGLNCLEIRNVAFVAQPDPNTFTFHVWFNNSDKISEFKAFNGATMFLFTVIKNDAGAYLVETMPVYTS